MLAILLVQLAEAARLPIISGDSNNWGSVLNSYLLVEHTENGTHKNLTVIGNANISGNLYVSNLTVNNNLIVFGNITNTTVNNVVVNGSFYPTFDNLFDIGNGTLRWRNANFSGVIDANSLRVNGKDVLLGQDAFTINNFTAAYDARTDRFTIQNLSRIGNININTSGSLNVSGNITFTQLKNCNTIDSDANGLLTCGIDETGSDASAYNLFNFTFNYNSRTDRFGNQNNTDATIPDNITINTSSPATFSSSVIFVSNVTFLGNVNLSIFNNIVNNLIPSINGTNSLGNSTNRWSVVYAVNLSGKLNCLDLYGGTDADFCSDSTSASAQVVNGSGTLNFIPKWITNTTLGNSTIFDNGNVGIGTTSPTNKLQVNGTINSSGDICTDAGGGKCLSTSLSSGANGTIPSGMIGFFAGACPPGWTEYTTANGFYIVAATGAKTIGGTVGTPLNNLEDVKHSHTVSLPSSSGTQGGSGTPGAGTFGTSANSANIPYIQLRPCMAP